MPNEPKQTERPRARFAPNVSVGGAVMDLAALRQVAQTDPAGFVRKIQTQIDEKGLRWNDVRDLRAMFHALSDIQVPARINVMGQTRAIMASAFPLLAGGLTVAGINDGFMAVPTIGQDLVTDIEDNKRFSSFASVTSEDDGIDSVKEGDPFPEIGAGEEKFTIAHKRNGRRISITAEMIEENDVSNIVQRVNALGEIAAELIEEQTLKRVTDLHGSTASAAEPYVLHLGGTGTQLYTTTANNPGTRAPSGTRVNNNALVDSSDLENARAVLAAMLNYRAKRIAIPISRCTLLVPDALSGAANKILGSELEPGVDNELNNWGPRGRYRPRYRSSPKLDDLSTTAWYLGWFEKQFKRKWKLRFEFVTLSGTTESFLQNRIAFQARVAWDSEVGAVDYNYVVQNLSGSTAPVP